MIEIKELRALRGPNRHSRHPVVFMVLDIKAYEDRPSHRLEGFTGRLTALIPSFEQHECSVGKPGGFIRRLEQGTWAGHIIEHIAIELQCLAGMPVGYGKTLDTLETGIYIVVFRYLVESAGLAAAKTAVTLFESVAEGLQFNLDKAVSDLKALGENDMLGPTTLSVVREAGARGIPHIRLNRDSYIQLGHGAGQKRIQASITCRTSAIAVEMADEKSRVKTHLKQAGIPVPRGGVASSLGAALALFDAIGPPVVVKPEVGNHGNGATIYITDKIQLKKAFFAARAFYPEVIIEAFCYGNDFRFLVIDGKFVAAAMREPAHITGDGESTIMGLIRKENADLCRGVGHEKTLTRIEVDDMTEHLLSVRGLSLDSVPGPGIKVLLKTIANLSKGGTATDVTDEVNPEICLMVERIAQIIGLDCAGIDAIACDISKPVDLSDIQIVEVNAAPGFRMHLAPTCGMHRNVAAPLVDMLFPKGYSPVPVLAVTGTNGKTTTIKLLSHTLKYAGKIVGMTSTTGICIDGRQILDGDYSGPEGAGIVLRDPYVDHIVLEAARGGIIRRGLGVDQVDIGVVLNIGTDHLGTDWIESHEALCLVKSTVVEVVRETGTSVLNADDAGVMSIANRARGQVILFSLNADNPLLTSHIKKNGTVVTLAGQTVVIRNKKLDIQVCGLKEIPITFCGLIDFNTANALAAIGALYGLGLPVDQIRNGITTFYPSATQNPGRMNLFDFREFKVLLDYGHNPEAVRALAANLPRLTQGRRLALVHGTGNRTDEQLMEYGMALAAAYHYILLADLDPRGRPAGETPEIVCKGLLQGGMDMNRIKTVPDLETGLDLLFSKVTPGDLLIIQPDDLMAAMDQINLRYRKMVARI